MKEKFEIIASHNPTPVRPLNSRFLVLFLSLVPNITSKDLLNAASRLLQTTYPQPSLFEGRGGEGRGPGSSTGFRKAWSEVWSKWEARELETSEERERVMKGARAERKRGVMGRKKRESFIFFCPSHHSFRPLSLTINSNIPQKVIAGDWEQCRGWERRLYTGYRPWG